MTELILLSQADLDIQTGFERYEDYQQGRGEVFMRQLDAAFTLLRQHPEVAPVYAGPYRRMLVREFPYGIFYQAQPARIIVAAIMDLRQDPQAIRRKLVGEQGD
jgi:plasmid stabilization system protein ParE